MANAKAAAVDWRALIAALPARSDLSLAVAVLGIIVVLVLPLPPALLDLLLATSFIFSVLILMTVLFIHTPLEFSVFPTVLLMATLLRLALNLASTRLILAGGHTGTDAAGYVIEAFGGFIMQGNIVIGMIVFGILVIVNFVVITKGSGRIAEVSARFTLDAMPGKQMAVDADLSSGLITEDEARVRRRVMEDESAFYGSMDGASKFVRGDAIAGLLVTVINLVGGMIVGVGQKGLTMDQAAQTYALLTVGDGLVTQIPSLIVSVAAGLLVSKSGVTGAADAVLIAQFSAYPKALGMSAAVMAIMGLLPGLPMLPFVALAGGAGYLAYRARSGAAAEESAADAAKKEPADTPPEEAPLSESLKMDDLKIELGLGLIPLTRSDGDTRGLTVQVKALRKQFAVEMGFVMPPVRLVDNVALDSNSYLIKVKEVEAGRGTLQVDEFLVMDPVGGQVDLPGTPTMEPAFGLPAVWVRADLQEEAGLKGYTVVDAATVLVTHMSEVTKAHMAEILSYSTVQSLLKDLDDGQRKLVDELVPDIATVSIVQRVLQALLAERVSIRDLPTILEAIAEIAPTNRSAAGITAHVRTRLARQLCAQFTSAAGYVPLISLSPAWEQAFLESIAGEGEARHLAMAPSKLQDFVSVARERFDQAAREGEMPVLLTGAETRPFVRSIIERFRSQTAILSQAEIHPKARLKTMGSI